MPRRIAPRIADVSRLSRIARLAVGAALATACAADPKPGPAQPDTPAPDGGAVAPMYGMPVDTPPPAEPDPSEPTTPDGPGATTPEPGPKDPGAVRPMYGVPPGPSQ